MTSGMQRSFFDAEHDADLKSKRGEVTARDVILLLLEQDDMIISPRPTVVLKAANLVQRMALSIQGESQVARINCSLSRKRGDREGW